MRKPILDKILYFLLATSCSLTVGCTSGFQANAPLDSQPLASSTPASIQQTTPDTPTQTSAPIAPSGPDTSDTNSKELFVTGADGEAFFLALQRTGVTDRSGNLGATNLIASEIECNTPVTPNAETTCRIYTTTSALNFSGEDASQVNSILVKLGGQVQNGNLGATTCKAYSVSCSRVVYPGATAKCSLSFTQ